MIEATNKFFDATKVNGVGLVSPELTPFIFPEYNYLSFMGGSNPRNNYEQIMLGGFSSETHSGLSKDIQGLLDIIHQHPDLEGMIQITSGFRRNSTTKQGRTSFHASGNAIDIVPKNGDFAQLERELVKYPDVIQYMQSKGIGILDETSAEMMNKTGATGKHFHIGKDKSAIKGLQIILNKYGLKI